MTQDRALEIISSGASVFITGAPGSGKSFVLQRFIEQASRAGKKVALTASTGIAASLLGGQTIHSWSGLGVHNEISSSTSSAILANDKLRDRLCATEILIIDEISMLDKNSLNALSFLLKMARGSAKPFGGLQLILSGDFFQLPPVSNRCSDYAFKSEAWQDVNPRICYLEEQHRQAADELYEILMALRERRFGRRQLELLYGRLGLEHGSLTRLVTHNSDADAINRFQLAHTPGQKFSYTMVCRGSPQASNRLKRAIMAPQVLELKKGVPTIFLTNNFAAGYANGSQGKVVQFNQGLPVVELSRGGLRVLVEAYSWKDNPHGISSAEAVQLPLRLAWALTIHKSQGMSLDSADINLKRSFTYGMGYVALSRLTSYSGLFLSGINSRSLQLDPLVYDFDLAIKRQSRQHVSRERTSHQDAAKALRAAGVGNNLINLTVPIRSKTKISNK